MRAKQNLASAVYETIAWFDVFDQPVTAEEIHRFLFKQKATLAEVKRVLYTDPRIGKSLIYFFLKGRAGLVILRCQRNYHAEKLWRRVTRYRFIFRAVPFLRFVAVGNTLAFGWPEKNSDIDLFVIAKKNRLFTTRFFLTFLTTLFGVRRHGNKIAQRFCLSFFMDEAALDLTSLKISQEDPYLAFWLATLVSVWSDLGLKFWHANAWVEKYFPNFDGPIAFGKSRKGLFRKIWEVLLGGKFGNLLEKTLRRWQLRRARNKQSKKSEPTAVIISEHMLKFHEIDRRREFLERWKKSSQRREKSPRVETSKTGKVPGRRRHAPV